MNLFLYQEKEIFKEIFRHTKITIFAIFQRFSHLGDNETNFFVK